MLQWLMSTREAGHVGVSNLMISFWFKNKANK